MQRLRNKQSAPERHSANNRKVWMGFWLRNIDNSEVIYVSPAYEKVWGCSLWNLYNKRVLLSRFLLKTNLTLLPNLKNTRMGKLRSGVSYFTTRWRYPLGSCSIFPDKMMPARFLSFTEIAQDIIGEKQGRAWAYRKRNTIKSLHNASFGGVINSP